MGDDFLRKYKPLESGINFDSTQNSCFYRILSSGLKTQVYFLVLDSVVTLKNTNIYKDWQDSSIYNFDKWNKNAYIFLKITNIRNFCY